MSEDTERSPLATIEALEAAAFRVGQVARRLLAEHPGLPVWEIRPRAIAYSRHPTNSAQLEISPRDTDAVRAWAEALGTTVDVKFYDNPARSHCFEYHGAECTIGGVEVSISATRRPSEEEITAWRTKRDQALADAEKDTRDAGDVHSADTTAGGHGE
ncbi:hypothetical protein AB0903_33630 [Streptomyces sp. NPDC048389]|uniref:hypothetical protein n=1 Tax=Streptomyces sp. NPDC048389 TaxID=3154622 RepID=UPI0034533196